MGPTTPHDRRYDKGERRFKHVSRGRDPIIEFDNSDPKKWVGKCPSILSEADRNLLLTEAIPAPNGDRELAVPKKLYAVHDGAIYEAQTSDHGRSYHGYPYRGKLSRSLLEKLRTMADKKDSLSSFDAWVKKHIVLHGQRK